jgi:hypothetical protein
MMKIWATRVKLIRFEDSVSSSPGDKERKREREKERKRERKKERKREREKERKREREKEAITAVKKCLQVQLIVFIYYSGSRLM